MQRLWVDIIDRERTAWLDLLAAHNLKAEKNIEAVYGIYDGDKLIATASHLANIIKCVAVDTHHQGGSIFNQLLSEIIGELSARGHQKIFVYTKPLYGHSFASLGFTTIAEVPGEVILMERARVGCDFNNYLSRLLMETAEQNPLTASQKGTQGAIVLNANPCTLGHLHLIEYGLSQCDLLHIFLVREDLSYFSFEDRRKMLIAGIADYFIDTPALILHDTADYLVSAATFPSYFLAENQDVTATQAKLDAKIFCRIALNLQITKRFVGSEPLSETTAIYNKVLRQILSANAIELVEIPRKEVNSEVISASRVRKLLEKCQFAELNGLVSDSVKEILRETP